MGARYRQGQETDGGSWLSQRLQCRLGDLGPELLFARRADRVAATGHWHPSEAPDHGARGFSEAVARRAKGMAWRADHPQCGAHRRRVVELVRFLHAVWRL